MLITKQIEIDMAHRVPNHKSKCRNLHGHRYKIEAAVDDKIITTKGSSDEGMVIDFADLKEILMNEIDQQFDHGAIFYKQDPLTDHFLKISASGYQSHSKIHFVDFIPTAENLCKHWFLLIKPQLKARGIKLKHIKVWETPTSTAIYCEDQK